MSEVSPAAILWDLDGTLVDSVGDLASALNVVLGRHGLPPRRLDAVRGMIGDGVNELLRRGFEAAGRPLPPAEVPSARQEFLAVYAAGATRQTRPMPGAAEALARLSREGWRHAVCTNKPTGIARDILAELGLATYIRTVVGGDTGLALKPDPAPLRACLDALGIPAERAVMVGDSGNDVAAAGAAGVAAVFARCGYGTPPDDAAGVAGFVDSLEELPVLARRIVAAGDRSHPRGPGVG